MSDKIVLYDRIKELSYTTGSGNIILEGSPAGFSSFASVYPHSGVLFYAITDGNNYEIGSGIFLRSDFSASDNILSNQIQRFPIRTSTNSIINWSTGLKEVYVTYPASHSVYTGSGIGSYNNPQVSGLAIWGGSHTLDYDPNLVWNSTLNRLGINKSNPSFAIDIGGQSYESIINASGYIVGNSGIKFASGTQSEHFLKNKLDIDAYNESLLSQTTGLSDVVQLSGAVNQYLLLKKQNAGLFFAGPPSGCGAPPCNPNYPSFRTITMSDLPPLSNTYASYSSGVNHAGRITFWVNNNTIGSDQYFQWDSINHKLSIGKPGIAPVADVEISGVVDILGRLNISSGIRLIPSNNIGSGNSILYQNANNQLVFNNEPYVSSGKVELMVSNAVSSFLLNDLNLNIALSGKSFIPTGTIQYSEVSGVNGQLLLDNQYLYAYTPSGQWRRIYLGNAFDIRSFGDNSFVPPDAPINLSGVPKNQSVHLIWTAPNSSLGIIDYIVQYSGVANSGWLTYGGENSEPRQNVNGLVNGQTYSFRVAAVSAVGSGAYSNTFQSVPNPTVPFAPLITSIANNNIDSITVNWTTPDNGGANISSYELEYTPLSGLAQYLNVGSVNTYTLNSTNGIQGEVAESPNGGAFYTVRVRATNSVGSSNYSTPASLLVRSIGPPSPPRSVQLESVTFDSATLSFILPEFAGHPGEPVSSLDYRALVRFDNFDNTAFAVSGSFSANNGYFYPVYLNSGIAALSGVPMAITMQTFKNITFYGVSSITQSGVASYPTNQYDLYNRYDQVVPDSPSADLRRSVTISNLNRDKLYNITLQSFNNNYNSASSNIVNANTTNPPLKPTNFIGFAESNSGIILSWTNPTQPLPVIDHSIKIGTPSVYCLDFENLRDFDRGTTEDLRVYNSANLGSLTVNKLGSVNYSSDSAVGTKSILLQGLSSARGLYAESSKDLEFGLNDFTVECFVKLDDVNKESILFDFRKNGLNPDAEDLEGEYFLLRVKPNGRLEYRDSEAQRSGFVTNTVLTSGTWHHVAFSRFNNISKIFVDNIAVSSGYVDNLKYLSSPFAFGYDTSLSNPSKNFIGKVDGIRVTNGVGLYVGNFTKPNYNFVDTQFKLNLTNYQAINLNFEQSSGNNNSIVQIPNVRNRLILQMDGDNNTFIDNSTNPNSIISVGNVTQSTNQISPVGGKSAYFDGNSYLDCNSSIGTLVGSENFTIEAWFYLTSPASGIQAIVGSKSSFPFLGELSHIVGIYNNKPYAFVSVGLGTFPVFNPNVQDISLNQWHRINFNRSGNTYYLNFDNVVIAEQTIGGLNTTGSGSLHIGAYDGLNKFSGYIDGVRILADDAYINIPQDNSTPTSQIAIPLVGNAQLVPFPKNGNNSLFIPGNGNNGFLQQFSNNELAFGVKDFTIESWVYPLALDNEYFLFDFRPTNKNSDPGGTYFLLTLNQNRGLNYYTDGKARISTSGNLSLGNWNKVEVSRNQGVTRVFVNGTIAGSLENDRFNFLNQNCRIGYTSWNNRPDYVNQNFIGYIDDFRVLKGVGLYTTNHSVSQSYKNILYAPSDYSSVILNFEEVTDDSLSIENSGNLVSQSTAVKKFGNHSLFFPSSGNNVVSSDISSNLHFGKKDFTIESWIYPTAISGTTPLFDFRPSNVNSLSINDAGVVDGTYLYLTLNSDRSISYITDGSTRIQSSGSAIPSGSWSHVALSRKNGISRLFINGVQHSGVYVDDNNFQPQSFRFGNTAWTSGSFNTYKGYADLINVSKVGQYTQNFTPPNNTFVEITNNNSYPAILLDYNSLIVDKTKQSPITVRAGTSTGNIIKFGSSSLYMGVSPSSPLGIETDESYLFAFSKNDFTVETWIYPTDLSNDQSIFDFRPSVGGGEINSTDNGTYFHLDISSNRSLRYKAGDSTLSNVPTGVISENTWQHIAVSRSNNITRLFVNGTQVGSDIVDNNNFLFSRFRIGPSVNASKNFKGYLDETRVLNGTGAYVNTFTTQSIPFTLGVKNDIASLTTKSDSIGPNNYFTIGSLDANQEYLFKLAPESVAGVGEYSDLIKVKTSPAFISVWNTSNVTLDTSLNDEVRLPLVANGNYNFYVSWGDGKFDLITNANYLTKSLHEYSTPGQYTITMQGVIDGWQFKEDGDSIKIQEVKSWGPLNFIDNVDRQFQGCSNLVITAKDYPKIGNTLSACFSDCISLNDSLENWDVSRCLDMNFMFLNCVAYNGDISKWDVSNVKSMRAMFLNAVSFNRDIGRWNTGKVFNMNSMLTNASSFNQDISLMRIDSLVDANRMLIGTDMSKQNYDNLLEFWGDIDTPKRSDVAFGISQEYSKNSISDAARQTLRQQYNWIINDYGSDNSFVFKIKSATDDFTFDLGNFFKTNTNDSSRSYGAMYVNFGDDSFLDIPTGSNSIIKNYYDKLSQELTVRIDGSMSNFNTKYNDSRIYITDIARWGGVSTFINNIPDRFSGCTNLLSVTAEDSPQLANSIMGFFSDCESLGSIDDTESTSNFILSFGLNINGQLGYDTSTASNPFPRKSTNKRWRKVANGKNHTLAIDNQGYLWSWGNNSSGQLGHGDRTSRITPARISNKTWNHIAAGRDHSLAIDNNGRLYAFGSNAYGQIGDGTNNNRLSPVLIDQIDTQWIYVSAGHDFSMAISDDGELYCWGNNEYSQLGTGDIVLRNVPTKIGIKTWKMIDAGRDHALAIDTSDNLYAWGNNAYGQLGLGNNNTANVPTLLSGSTWKKISAGEFYSLAINSLDKAYGWGNNAYGQLGNQQGKNSGNKINAPSVIRNDLTFTNIYAGYRHSAAIQSNKDMWLWGDNTYGQLGYQTSQLSNSELPVKLNSTNNFGNIALGEYHTSSILDEPPVSSTSLEDWNLVNVTDISNMFRNCSSFNVDIDSWNTSSVVSMSYCFAGATAFNRSLNSWNTSSVIDMSSMFAGAISFDEDIAGWDTYNVRNMSNMFNGASSFDKNVGFWDISKVKDMSFMFTNAVSLSTRTYSNILVRWSTAQVQRGVVLHASSYYDGSSVSVMSARNYLLSNDWTINDLGAINV